MDEPARPPRPIPRPDAGTPQPGSASSAAELHARIAGLERELADRTAALRHSLEEIKRLTKQLQRENTYLRAELQNPYHDVVGTSPAFARVLEAAARVAATDATVLLTGETGTGKEVIAHHIHRLSRRRTKPLVRVNCAALTDTLVAAELFGHEKGAFTGADRRRPGRFELADHGTIFLDEIGEISADVQAKLLRVLQERELERVGGTQTIPVDVRVIAATNRDLEALVAEGRFRKDLLYRLNVFPVHLPPLRERRGDVAALARYFLERFGKGMHRRVESISPATLRLFESHHWPGNIRELQNLVERAVILTDGTELHVEASLLPGAVDIPGAAGAVDGHVPGGATGPATPARPIPFPDGAPPSAAPANGADAGAGRDGVTLEDLTRRHIADVLRQTRGKIYGSDGAAAKLGLKPTTLQAKLKRLGLSRGAPQGVGADEPQRG